MSEESELLKTITSLLASDNQPPKEETAEQTQEDKTDENSLDLGLMLKLGSMFSELGADDNRAKLLRDLKPFLSAERREKVESAIKILKLLKIAEKAKNENLL